jgi:hypothetical protein
MVRIYVRHKVANYAAWRKTYDDFESERRPMGVTGHAVYRSVDDPNDVTVWHDFATVEKAKAFGASPKLKDAMAKAGVQSTPEIWFVTGTARTGAKSRKPKAQRKAAKTRRRKPAKKGAGRR